MARLRLPDVRRIPADRLPPALRGLAGVASDASPASLTLLLGRREFLKALGLLLAALAAPVTWAERAVAAGRGRFLTRAELATLEALCDRIIPPDRDPGARALGVATYIDRMLAAFGHRVPLIFAGGPFSNRNPFPDDKTGKPSHRRPKDAFRRFIPLTRVQELRWRAELFGSAAVPGADFNDAALGPLRGLRDVYRDGLEQVNAAAQKMKGRPFHRLAAADQDAVFAALDTPAFLFDARRGMSFLDLVIQHTFEGCFAVPEYGGNRRGAGWRMIGLEGDDQPLGYSIFSREKNDYNERADHPMSTPNPDEVAGAKPITADGDHIQNSIYSLTQIFGE